MRALIIDHVSSVIERNLREYGVEVDVSPLPGREGLKKLLPQYDILIMRVDPKMDREMLDAAAGSIKMICVCSAGTNHIDLAYAKELGIPVQNAPGINSNAVAELTISKMLDLSRMNVEANNEVQMEGIFNKYKYTGHELKGHVLGIIGFGKIGKRVGKLARAFDMATIAYDPYLEDEVFASEDTARCATLQNLLEKADYVTVHTPITPETKNMITTAEFAKMKDGAIVINCARGGIINEDDALAALKEGKIAGLGLDVLSSEIAGKDLNGDTARLQSPLFGQKGFIISPHTGGSTHEAYDGIGEFISEKIVERFGLEKQN